MHVWGDESGATESVTYAEMSARAGRLANALQDLSVQRGYAVGLVFPMHPSGLVAALAYLRIGTVFTQIFPEYGPEAIGHRLADAGAELVLTVDGYRRNGAMIDLSEKVERGLDYAPGVTVVVVHERGPHVRLRWGHYPRLSGSDLGGQSAGGPRGDGQR